MDEIQIDTLSRAQLFPGLTMSVDVAQLIVHVEEAPEAFWSRGDRPVTRQDVFVKPKVLGGLCKIQQPRPSLKHHHNLLQPTPSHVVDSAGPLTIYILDGSTLRTARRCDVHR